MDNVWVDVSFEALIRLPNFNIGGVGGFDFTDTTATVKGNRILDVEFDGNVKNRLEDLLRANQVDLIEVRILEIKS